MRVAKATAKYEEWLGRRLRLIEADLAHKHEQMRSAPFPFMRATYYRWAQTWAKVCGDAARGPRVLAVGDLHVENFGTWRDIEGRLVWGINDFDEGWPLPYTNDLIRLATSALLARMNCAPEEAIRAIIEGYTESLEAGGRPIVLAEHHGALRAMATERLHEPEKYWEKLHALPPLREEPPAPVRKTIDRMMPEPGLRLTWAHRVAGLGSLGRERYVALATWRGGSVAREAKPLAPSACFWAEGGKCRAAIHYQEILDRAVRCRDHFMRFQKGWIVRRLAPDCSRIELPALPKERDEARLLHAMGWETANVHLGSAHPRALLKDMEKRPTGWLLKTARKMEEATIEDFNAMATRR